MFRLLALRSVGGSASTGMHWEALRRWLGAGSWRCTVDQNRVVDIVIINKYCIRVPTNVDKWFH